MAYLDSKNNGPLDQYLSNLDGLLQKLSGPERRALSRVLAVEMRQRIGQRIKDNVSPKGEAYAGRRGGSWDLRPLRKGETLKPGQKFNYLKERDIQLAWVKDAGGHYIGREVPNSNYGYAASGYKKELIYIKGRAKSNRMFRKLPSGRWLRYKTDDQQAAIGFMNGLVGQIAAEHQDGNATKNLPSRELIGFAKDDLSFIEDTVIKHLGF